MRALLSLFWRIAIFKAGPQDLPYSVPLCIFLIFCNTVLAWVHFKQVKLTADPALVALILMGVTAVFTYIVLRVRSASNRFVQVLTALVGLNFLINLAATPLLIIPMHMSKNQLPQLLHALISFIYLALVLAVNVWVMMINAFIYSQALTVNLLSGLLVAIGLLGLNILVYAHFSG